MGRAEDRSFHLSVIEPVKIAPIMGADAPEKGSFGDDLAAAARLIIADTRDALANTELTDAEAVHQVRRHLKRWRALMRLLAEPLGKRADKMRREARALMRSLSGARDAQSALDALDDLRKTDLPFSPTSVNTIRKRLTDLRDSAEQAAFTDVARIHLTRYLDYALLSLERWPIKQVDFGTMADQLTETYRLARKRMPADWKNPDPEDLHELRRRVVEHRHQMDLIEYLWPRLSEVWGEETQRLRNRLGACQDLEVLSKLLEPHQPLAHWRGKLLPIIQARRAAHLRNAARLAGRLFAEKPKAFRQRIAALWDARSKKR